MLKAMNALGLPLSFLQRERLGGTAGKKYGESIRE
jgi:hypothetical protein